MIYIFAFIINIGLCWLLVEFLPFQEINFLKHFLEANNLFCIQYLGFSCGFLVCDAFAVWKSLTCVFVCSIILMVVLTVRKVKKKTWEHKNCSKQELVLLLVTIGLIVPFIYITTEDISADSDQGAYFLHTCILMEEKSKEIHSLQEIGKISDDVDEGVRELLEDLPSFWHEDNKDVYYIHALNSWCAYSALFGKMFGIWNSMKAVNYLYILTVFNLFYVCKKYVINKLNIYLYIIMFALSPLLLYIGKAGLSEIAVLFLLSIGLNYIFEEEEIFSIISGICIGFMGYVHVSMYAYIPAVTGVALLESTRRKKAAWFNVNQLLMFGFSIWYVYKISPLYVKKQYFRFTLNERIDYTAVFALIELIVISGIAVQILTVKQHSQAIIKLRGIIYGNYKKISIVVWSIVLISTIYYGYFMCFTDAFAIEEGVDAGTWNLRSEYINKGISAVSHLNIVNISRAVGMIGLLIFVAIPFWHYELSDTVKSFYYIALYGMIIWTVLQMDTPSNYYSSRYFVPVLIPMIVLTVVFTVKSKNWCIYIILVVMLYNHHFWPAFLKGGPKVGQYELLKDVLETIPEDAVILCNPESHMINARLSANLRVLNNNKIYNLDNAEEVLNFYSNNDVYIISENELETDARFVKSNIYTSQYSFGNGVNGTYDTTVGTYSIPLYIYQTACDE